MLARHGAAVVDADLVAREVVEPGTPGLAEVVRAFGREMLAPDGSLDRRRLGALVFASTGERRRLEAITHPLIRARIAELVVEAGVAGPPLIAVDVPLLFETGGGAAYPDGVLLVYADEEVQLDRLRARDGLGPADAVQRVRTQMPIAAKVGLATWVIDNGGTREETEAQVDRWWEDVVG